MQSWGPFGPPPESWDNNNSFDVAADPFTPAPSGAVKPADPWASTSDPWATAPTGPPQHQQSYDDLWGVPALAHPMPLPSPKGSRRPALLIGSATAVVAVLALVTAGVLAFRQQGNTTAREPVSPTVAIPTSELTSTPSYTATTTPPPTTTSALPSGEAALGQNRIYADFDAGLAKQQCNPPGWPSDAAAAQIFYEAAILCLDKAWEPLLTGVGMKFRSPNLSITKNCGDAPVGPGGYAALYCTEGDTLYIPVTGMPPEKYGDKAIIYLSMLAHEYGHHLQHLTGTTREASKQERAAGKQSAEGLELLRREELQAQCLSGMFIGSIVDTGGRFTVADSQVIANGNWDAVSPRDHGSPEHYGSWWDQGYRLNKIGECNTWLSPPSDVS